MVGAKAGSGARGRRCVCTGPHPAQHHITTCCWQPRTATPHTCEGAGDGGTRRDGAGHVHVSWQAVGHGGLKNGLYNVERAIVRPEAAQRADARVYSIRWRLCAFRHCGDDGQHGGAQHDLHHGGYASSATYARVEEASSKRVGYYVRGLQPSVGPPSHACGGRHACAVRMLTCTSWSVGLVMVMAPDTLAPDGV